MNSQAALQTTNRIIAAILGGYAFTWGFSVLGITSLVALGIDFHEAETGLSLIAFLVFLGLFLWAFAAKSMIRVWLVLAGGAAIMMLIGTVLQNSLLS
ncbi:MAG: iron uptake protein [Methylophaga sp.]|nr:iron uptake protein [Methylophaga sp.]MED5509098.1 iron uptake protein [Pseudomonadota bacterium]